MFEPFGPQLVEQLWKDYEIGLWRRPERDVLLGVGFAVLEDHTRSTSLLCCLRIMM